MDSSPNYGLSPIPNGCVGCNWSDEVKVLHRVTPHCPGGAMIDTPPTTPQVTTPQSLVGEGRSGVVSALLLLPPVSCQEPPVAHYCFVKPPGTSSSALLIMLVVAYCCFVKPLGTSSTSPFLLPLDISSAHRV